MGRNRTSVPRTNRPEFCFCQQCRRLLFQMACDVAPRDMSRNCVELARLTAEFVRRLLNESLVHASLMPNLRTSRAPQSYVRWTRRTAAAVRIGRGKRMFRGAGAFLLPRPNPLSQCGRIYVIFCPLIATESKPRTEA
jgi:hypothetical protein